MNHEKYIQRCLALAQKGIGTTRPNPSVGAVVVHNNKIIGEGYTSPYGGPHAEVNAIRAVKDESLFKEATIYVTLEPCSHYGKTPPCADLIVEKQIPNVVIGCIDTHSLVAGKGVARLQKAGCNVTVGVLEEACLAQHKRFFTVQNKQRPYIILKWAETTDGFIAPKTKNEQKPVWISSSYSQQLVHKWRSEEHAIFVGTQTVIDDNPSLTVRSYTGENPIRVVIDKNLRIPTTATVFNTKVKTIVITAKVQESKENLIYEVIDFTKDVVAEICAVLQRHKIQSIIIEGGRQTLQSFITSGIWDEARVFIGENQFKEGVVAPKIQGNLVSEEKIASDILRIFKND